MGIDSWHPGLGFVLEQEKLTGAMGGASYFWIVQCQLETECKAATTHYSLLPLQFCSVTPTVTVTTTAHNTTHSVTGSLIVTWLTESLTDWLSGSLSGWVIQWVNDWSDELIKWTDSKVTHPQPLTHYPVTQSQGHTLHRQSATQSLTVNDYESLSQSLTHCQYQVMTCLEWIF